jgi:colicin import membrane protein
MARRLKTYQTSSGFFDLAVAAPAMKAAGQAWGSRTNVFNQGFPKVPQLLLRPWQNQASFEVPGWVKWPGPFIEHAELPRTYPSRNSRRGQQSRTKNHLLARPTRKLHEWLQWHLRESRRGAK